MTAMVRAAATRRSLITRALLSASRARARATASDRPPAPGAPRRRTIPGRARARPESRTATIVAVRGVAGEEADLADRLADADLADGVLLAFDPDLEAAGYDDVDGVGCRALTDQDLAAQQVVKSRARPDFGQLIVRQLAEDRCRAKQDRGAWDVRLVCHGDARMASAQSHVCRAAGVRQRAPGPAMALEHRFLLGEASAANLKFLS